MSVVIYELRDKILREVARAYTTTKMWFKLESLYMTKILAHMLCVKQQLNLFYNVNTKFIVERLTNIYKIYWWLGKYLGKFDDEDNTLILLISLPRPFKHFKDSLCDPKVWHERGVTSDAQCMNNDWLMEYSKQKGNKNELNSHQNERDLEVVCVYECMVKIWLIRIDF